MRRPEEARHHKKKSKQRDRRPALFELDKLMKHFGARRREVPRRRDRQRGPYRPEERLSEPIAAKRQVSRSSRSTSASQPVSPRPYVLPLKRRLTLDAAAR